MTKYRVYVFSEEDDSFYVKHLEEVCSIHNTLEVRYRIGSQCSDDEGDICSHDTGNTNAALIKSYSFVSNYNKIPNTYYWVNPTFDVMVYENKIIATPCKIDKETKGRILRQFITPQLNSDNITKFTSATDLKNYAKCSNRYTVTLS